MAVAVGVLQLLTDKEAAMDEEWRDDVISEPAPEPYRVPLFNVDCPQGSEVCVV